MGEKGGKEKLQRGSVRETHGLGAERALARARNALRGQEPGGKRKISAAEAGSLEGLPTRSALPRRAGSPARW